MLLFCRPIEETIRTRTISLDCTTASNHTFSMKTTISIPDSVFQAAEKYAKRMHKSRSQLFSEAMVEYLERHMPDEITRALNEMVETIGDVNDAFMRKASHSLLEQSEW